MLNTPIHCSRGLKSDYRNKVEPQEGEVGLGQYFSFKKCLGNCAQLTGAAIVGVGAFTHAPSKKLVKAKEF